MLTIDLGRRGYVASLSVVFDYDFALVPNALRPQLPKHNLLLKILLFCLVLPSFVLFCPRFVIGFHNAMNLIKRSPFHGNRMCDCSSPEVWHGNAYNRRM